MADSERRGVGLSVETTEDGERWSVVRVLPFSEDSERGSSEADPPANDVALPAECAHVWRNEQCVISPNPNSHDADSHVTDLKPKP